MAEEGNQVEKKIPARTLDMSVSDTIEHNKGNIKLLSDLIEPYRIKGVETGLEVGLSSLESENEFLATLPPDMTYGEALDLLLEKRMKEKEKELVGVR